MTMQKGNPSRQATPEQFGNEMRAFLAYIQATVREVPGTDPKFPGFKLIPEIKNKIKKANNLFATGEICEAFRLLDNASSHFNNCQARYARNLLPDLEDHLKRMSDVCSKQRWGDLKQWAEAKSAVHAFASLLESSFFDVDEASKMYWKAIDANEMLKIAIETRNANKARQAIERQQQEAEANKARQEQLRRQKAERDMQECVQQSSQIAELVAAL